MRVKVTQCRCLWLHCTTLLVALCGVPQLLGLSLLASQEMAVGVVAWKSGVGGSGR